MARRRSATLTDGEARLMRVLWDRQSATVADVVCPTRSRTTARCRRCCGSSRAKGYVDARKGRPRLRLQAARSTRSRRAARALSHLVSGLFNNSPSLLVLNVLEDERIDPRELDRLQAVDQWRASSGERTWTRARQLAVAGMPRLRSPRRSILRASRRISATTRYQTLVDRVVHRAVLASIQLPARRAVQRQPRACELGREQSAASRSSAGSGPRSAKLAGSGKLVLSTPPAWTGALLVILWLASQRCLSHERRRAASRCGASSARRGHFRQPARPGSTRGSRCARSAAARGWWCRMTSAPRRCSGSTSPSIAVAPGALEALDDHELDQIVVHEWAHVQRRDDLARLVTADHRRVRRPASRGLVDRSSAAISSARPPATTGPCKRPGRARGLAVCLTKLAALPGRPSAFGAGARRRSSPPQLTTRVVRLLDGTAQHVDGCGRSACRCSSRPSWLRWRWPLRAWSSW